eukprot:TRINITY_DN3073_c1_g1_i1.p1 TRINITY_DN3073_c1_g1~~TRINITY_DN3073_c1_g1_i1.p1  ORF type:complete len:1373 (-),score=291.65 TRINITY_DN3073_c1_g1_i1:337-4431(-)
MHHAWASDCGSVQHLAEAERPPRSRNGFGDEWQLGDAEDREMQSRSVKRRLCFMSREGMDSVNEADCPPTGTEPYQLPCIRECLDPRHAACFQFERFNAVQAAVWQQLYNGSDSVVLSAPTGAGKTVLFELAILGMLRHAEESSSTSKVLYLAPLKALCQEKASHWETMFSSLGERVAELTGDDQEQRGKTATMACLEASRVIVATPDMWDYFCRQHAGSGTSGTCPGSTAKAARIMEAVELVCIDEVHMLNLPKRGALLEAVVARLRTLCGQRRPLRFVAVSATVPNIRDIGDWLGAPSDAVQMFGPEHRPVPLTVEVLPRRSSKNEFLFQESLNRDLTGVINQFSDGRATLVFCSTKKACETAAKHIQQETSWQTNPALCELLAQKARWASDPGLQQLLPHGLAIHHAGLNLADRRLVAELFTMEAVRVLFCTQTLALGVNLPARLVIVKGTMAYKEGGWVEYDELEMLQIIGRAGRPQFDSQGVAVIMVEERLADRWRQQILGTRPIDSHLADRLTEAVLAEVVAGTTSSAAALATWLRGTFLAVRACRDPARYAAAFQIDQAGQSPHPLLRPEGPNMDQFVDMLCEREIQRLQGAGLLLQGGSPAPLAASALGRAACRFAVQYSTLAWMQKENTPEDLRSLLWLVTRADDFEEFKPRQGERVQLRNLAKSSAQQVRWPISGPIDTAGKKVFVLIQLSLADSPRVDLPWDLKSQQMQVLRRAETLLRVVAELYEAKREGAALANACLLRTCLHQQIWETSKMHVRQLRNIGDMNAEKLAARSMSTFEQLAAADPRQIELAVGRHAPFGDGLKAELAGLPRPSLTLAPEGCQGSVQVLISPGHASPPSGKAAAAASSASSSCGFAQLVAFVVPGCKLVEHRRMPAHGRARQIQLVLPEGTTGLVVRLIHEGIVGMDEERTIGTVQPQAAKRCKNHGNAASAPQSSLQQPFPALPQSAADSEHSSAKAAPARRQKRAAKAKASPAPITSCHDATFALARSKQSSAGISRVQTLASAAGERSGLPLPESPCGAWRVGSGVAAEPPGGALCGGCSFGPSMAQRAHLNAFGPQQSTDYLPTSFTNSASRVFPNSLEECQHRIGCANNPNRASFTNIDEHQRVGATALPALSGSCREARFAPAQSRQSVAGPCWGQLPASAAGECSGMPSAGFPHRTWYPGDCPLPVAAPRESVIVRNSSMSQPSIEGPLASFAAFAPRVACSKHFSSMTTSTEALQASSSHAARIACDVNSDSHVGSINPRVFAGGQVHATEHHQQQQQQKQKQQQQASSNDQQPSAGNKPHSQKTGHGSAPKMVVLSFKEQINQLHQAAARHRVLLNNSRHQEEAEAAPAWRGDAAPPLAFASGG